MKVHNRTCVSCGDTLENLKPKIFSTPKNLTMLNYQTDSQGSLTLRADVFPCLQEVPPFESWFGEPIPLDHVQNFDDYRVRAVRILCNKIALQTRRAVGNILFVPDHATQVFFEHATSVHFIDRYVIDHNMKSNELRAAFWKLSAHDGTPLAVDGGVQFSNEGFSCNPNMKNYFARCFL